MTDCSKIPTLTLVEDAKKGMNDIVSFAEGPGDTYTSQLDGEVRETIPGITRSAQDAYRLGASNLQGVYGVDVTFDESNWTYTYNGQEWGLSGDFDLSSLPYVATEVDPNNDDNLAVRGNASEGYVQQQDTKAQEELLPTGSQIFPEVGNLENGDIVTAGTTHLRVEVGGKSNIVAMSPVVSGVVAGLTETSATIGATNVELAYTNYVVTTVATLSTLKLGVGTVVVLKDRSYSKFLVVQGGTPNGFDILDVGNGNTAVYQHIIGTRVYPEHFGAVGDGIDYETDVIAAWGAYGNALTPKAGKGVYLIDDTIDLKGDILWDEGSKFSVDSTFPNLNVIEITEEDTQFNRIGFTATDDAGDHRYIYATGVAGLKMKNLQGENLESIGDDSYPVFSFDGCPNIDIDGVTFIYCAARNLLGVWNADYTVRNVKSYGSVGRVVDAVGDVVGTWDHIRVYNQTPDARLSANAVYAHAAGEKVTITDVKITGEFRESDEQAIKISRGSRCKLSQVYVDCLGPVFLNQGSPTAEVTDFYFKTTSVLTPVQFYPHPTTATNFNGARLKRGRIINQSNSTSGGACINIKGSIGGYENKSSDLVIEDVEVTCNSLGVAAIICNDGFIESLSLLNVNVAGAYGAFNCSASGGINNVPRDLKIKGGSYKTLVANAIPVITSNETIAPPVGYNKANVSVIGVDFVHTGTGSMVQSRNSTGLLNTACVNNTYEGAAVTPFDIASENAPVNVNNTKVILE